MIKTMNKKLFAVPTAVKGTHSSRNMSPHP